MKLYRSASRISLTVLVAALAACGGGDESAPPPAINLVTYEVSGVFTSSANVTYQNGSGGTEQKTVTLPATLPSFLPMVASSGQFLYISAQNNSSSGTVTVKILVNGSVFKSATSSGAYSIATASGSCC